MKEQIKQRIETLGISQRYLAKKHRRTPQQVSQALNGEQPTLLKKILAHLDKLERLNNN